MEKETKLESTFDAEKNIDKLFSPQAPLTHEEQWFFNISSSFFSISLK